MELDENPIETLDNKAELAAFKRQDLAKVVGYFESTSSVAYDEFLDASLDFTPMLPFYAVFDRQLAKQLGMKEVGSVQFYEPLLRWYYSKEKILKIFKFIRDLWL